VHLSMKNIRYGTAFLAAPLFTALGTAVLEGLTQTAVAIEVPPAESEAEERWQSADMLKAEVSSDAKQAEAGEAAESVELALVDLSDKEDAGNVAIETRALPDLAAATNRSATTPPLLVHELMEAEQISEDQQLRRFRHPTDTISTQRVAQNISVFELSDVQPTDWAYQALQSLVEDYDCIVGLPDQTYQGDRAVTRYEFAAGVSACLDSLQTMIVSDAGSGVAEPDLVIVERLRDDFSNELAQLQSQVSALEARTAELEAQQFSTTTRLFGQVVVGVQQRTANTADFFPVDGVKDTADPGDSLSLITNAQLSLLTQFSDRSLLLLGIQAGDGGSFPALTNNVRLGFEGDTNYNFQISDLTYRHLIGDSFAFVVGAQGTNAVNVFRGANRVESAGFGPISALAQRNPIINIGRGSAGIGFDWQIARWASLQGVYSVPTAEATDPTVGIFQGDRTVGFQLNLLPVETVDLAFNYINSYSGSGNLFTFNGDSQLTAGDAITTNAFGGTAAWRITPHITVGGWGGYTTSVTPGEVGSVDTVNWMAFLNFPDLFGEGNLGGIYVGQPPKITGSTLRQGQNIPSLLAGGLGDPGGQSSSTTHLEVFYRYRVNQNLAITPGFMVIFNPSHTAASDTIGVGVLRTTLVF
jgi:hypothetical protein